MKKILFLTLALGLAACSAAPVATQVPAAVVAEASPTPVVVIQTVVVPATAAPTDVPPPTPVPPTAEPVVVTVVVQASPVPPTAAPVDTPAGSAGSPITVDPTLGRGVFSSITMSGDHFTLRCAPRDITFNVTTPNVDIKNVVFYYRIVDLKRLYPSEWKTFGKMVDNGNGNFSLTFSGEDVSPNLRLDGSFFDFQFVGVSKSGDVVDRSEKISELVKYTFDCP